LQSDLTADELATLAMHDSDGFVRFDAIQSLARDTILETYEALKSSGVSQPSYASFIEVYQSLLSRAEEDTAFAAELLSLPSEIELSQGLEDLDPGLLHQARETLKEEIASQCEDKLLDLYQSLSAASVSDGKSGIGARRLRGLILQLLGRLTHHSPLLMAHYKSSETMTDQIAALSAINDGSSADREEVLSDFYNRFKGNDLVIDKWFAVQAQSNRSDVLDSIKDLFDHPDFSYSNPNRLRSLVGSLGMVNAKAFHDPSGEGYHILLNALIKVDKINPQTAARLAIPLGRWERLEPKRQKLMKDCLEILRDTPGLSKDVGEIVSKSLE